jgi:hypothetical protein
VGEVVSLPDQVKRSTTPAASEEMMDLFRGSDTPTAKSVVLNHNLTSSPAAYSHELTLALTEGHRA